MQCRDFIKLLQKQSPEDMALDWDNPGLIAGRMNKEVKRVLLAVDVTDAIVQQAIELKVDMLITHHPLIFASIRKVNSEDFIGRRLISLISNDINYYAMHTNFDVCGMADYCSEILGLENCEILEVTGELDGKPQGIGRVGSFSENHTLREIAEMVKERFSIPWVKVFGNLDVKPGKIAISSGAGKSMIGPALSMGAELLITGDIDHHAGIDANASGLAIIDAGHYGIEKVFIPFMAKYISENTDMEVFQEEWKSPFTII